MAEIALLPLRRRVDPRMWQIAALAGLLAWGIGVLGFDIPPARVALLLAAAVAAQWICSRLRNVPRFDPKSALISGLSLCLLLRTGSAAIAAAVATAAVASKFVIRFHGK